MKLFLLFVLLIVFASCQELVEAPVPDLHWAAFDSPEAKPLTNSDRKALEGIYAIGEAADDFGKEAALKWTYVVKDNDTTYYMSLFCSEDVRYFICQGKKRDSTILLNGYWRNIENIKTGKAHFTLAPVDGKDSNILIAGTFGIKDKEPQKKISFKYLRPLYNKTPYYLVAHRGGGRNNDLLPASENSVEMIPLASQLGANGIEIDVQLTKDSVPVLLHDANINDRLTTKTGIHGGVDEYTWNELQTEVNLKRGGKIPTLQQALETVLYKTPLEFVWLDCKYKTVLPKVKVIQASFLEKAKSMGRKLEIVIGIPDEDVMKTFMQLPDYKNIPSLCELDTSKAIQLAANFWAPAWVKGHQDEEVAAMHAKGKKTLVWTVDIPDKIKELMYRAYFNGIVTNRPSMAAYYYYAQQ
ncbi:MAG: glycerophosphodiester phosphodiesterase [Bacteroidota bacterium]|nr:glycerophosphodiester phosphodiesterase [Bacteroidota bacterium]